LVLWSSCAKCKKNIFLTHPLLLFPIKFNKSQQFGPIHQPSTVILLAFAKRKHTYGKFVNIVVCPLTMNILAIKLLTSD